MFPWIDTSLQWAGGVRHVILNTGEASRAETCAAASDCQAGLSCFGTPDGAFACHTLCNGAGLPDCEGTCEGIHRKVGPDQTVKYCQ